MKSALSTVGSYESQNLVENIDVQNYDDLVCNEDIDTF